MQTAPRAFRRNASINSSSANNAEAVSQATAPLEAVVRDPGTSTDWNDVLAQQDVGDSGVSSLSFPESCQPCQQCPGSAACMEEDVSQQQPPLLILGSSAGVFAVDLVTQELQLLGLEQLPVGQLSYGGGLLLTSCPVPDDLGVSAAQHRDAAAAAGLYCLTLNKSCSSSPFATEVQASKLWDGNARCSAVVPPAADAAGAAAVPRIYIGTQPAELLFSDDLGTTWSSTGLASTPQSKGWYRMLPPYEPACRSIVTSYGAGVVRDSCCCDSSAVQDGQAAQGQVLVGLEAGGTMSFSPSCSAATANLDSLQQQQPEPATASACDANSSSAWQECSQGLCRDIQALQHDPFSSKLTYAVAGSGNLPGGVYRRRGNKWKRLFGYRYSVGMAISRQQKGRLLLVSADKPPAIGCSLFESLDGGRHWANITDEVADAAARLTDHEPDLFEQTPVTMFVPGGLVVGCGTGHLFHATALPTGGFSTWRLLAKLPTAVNCMCLTDAAAAPAAVSRA